MTTPHDIPANAPSGGDDAARATTSDGPVTRQDFYDALAFVALCVLALWL